MKREAIVFVKHISDSIRRIDSFMGGVSEENFLNNEEKQSAVVRQLEIIGEAVKNIPDSFMKKYPIIPWNDIAKTRDKIIHHYFGVDLNTIWKVVNENIPELKKEIEEILKKEKIN